MRLSIDVLVWRGSVAEARHRLQAAVCDAHGGLVAGTDDPGLVTTFRSAAKPFQLAPLVERGHADRWGFDDEALAVMASSHTGSGYHLDLVRRILERIGVEERHLACGADDPLDSESLAALRDPPARPTPLHHNCSGKHAGMLALARAEGWPLEGYHLPTHPVQQLMLESVADASGVPPERIPLGVDGCSVCVFGLPLAAMARAYARLSVAGDGSPHERSLARVRRAMTAHPVATGGAQRFSTRLMQAAGGRLVAKGGAEGLECVGIPGRGLGVALKCEDGANRGGPPALVEVLAALDALPEPVALALEPERRPRATNAQGLDVGWIEPRVRVLDPSGN